MADRPILFRDEMVCAILDGRKTVTRRVGPTWARVQPGQRLWVRECWARGADGNPHLHSSYREAEFVYRSDMLLCYELQGWKWKPSIHMPRAACRLELEVVSVTEQYGLPGAVLVEHPVDATGDRVECAVDDAEAVREGFADPAAFLAAWRSMHPDHVGPVYRVEFRRSAA